MGHCGGNVRVFFVGGGVVVQLPTLMLNLRVSAILR